MSGYKPLQENTETPIKSSNKSVQKGKHAVIQISSKWRLVKSRLLNKKIQRKPSLRTLSLDEVLSNSHYRKALQKFLADNFCLESMVSK